MHVVTERVRCFQIFLRQPDSLILVILYIIEEYSTCMFKPLISALVITVDPFYRHVLTNASRCCSESVGCGVIEVDAGITVLLCDVSNMPAVTELVPGTPPFVV